MTVFITGATGFLGRNTVEALRRLAPDASLRCLIRHPEKASFLAPDEIVHGDLQTPASYRDALKDAEIVLHIAALVGLRDGAEFYATNTEGTRHFLDTAQDSGSLKRLVFVSSISAVDRPLDERVHGPMTEETVPHPNTDYGKSKRDAERLIQTSGLPYTILRPSYIYGPYPRLRSSMDRIIHDVKNQARYTSIPFTGRASEIYVADLAELLWHVAQHPKAENEVFFTSTPEPAAIKDVFPMLAHALGVPHAFRDIRPDAMRRFQASVYREFPNNPLMRVLFEDNFYCSSQKLYNLTGYVPPTSLAEGLEKTLHWYKGTGLL